MVPQESYAENKPALVQALMGKTQAVPPMWLMRQAGRYLPEYQAERQKLPNFMEFCFTPEAVIKVTLQPIERFDFDAAIIFSDILTIPHLLGQTVTFKAGHGPSLIDVDWSSFLERSKDTSLHEKFVPLYTSLKAVRAALPSHKALIGFAGSPWTISTYMVQGGKSQDFTTIMKFAKDSPLLFKGLIDLLTQQVSELLLGQIKAGCDVVQIFDSWANAVPLEKREEWLWQPLKKITNKIRQSYPDTPIIYYGRGMAPYYADLAQQIPGLAFGLDQSVNPQWAKENVQPFATVQGNLDPEKLVAGGFEDDLRNILVNLAKGPFVFNLGHGILPQTPITHVYELVEKVRSWGG